MANQNIDTVTLFRPRTEPARQFYDFIIEHGGFPELIWPMARDYAQQNGMHVLTLDRIKRIDRLASGHTDYALKFACGIRDAMTPISKETK